MKFQAALKSTMKAVPGLAGGGLAARYYGAHLHAKVPKIGNNPKLVGIIPAVVAIGLKTQKGQFMQSAADGILAVAIADTASAVMPTQFAGGLSGVDTDKIADQMLAASNDEVQRMINEAAESGRISDTLAEELADEMAEFGEEDEREMA